ncbi:MAG: ATP-binding protein [Fusobacteriota bacterium]
MKGIRRLIIISLIILQALFLSAIYKQYKNFVLQTVKGNLRDQALVINHYLDKNNIDELSVLLDSVENRVTIIDQKGQVLYDNKKEGDEESMDSHKYRKEVQKSYKGEEGFILRYSNTINEYLIYYSLPATNDLVVRVSRAYKDIRRSLIEHVTNWGILILTFNIILILIYLYIKNKYMSRLKRIKEKIRNSKKDSVIDLYLEDTPELKEVWEEVKKNAEQRLKATEDLRIEKNKLKKIVSSMDSGIISLKKSGEVILYNDKAKQEFLSNTLYDDYKAKVKSGSLRKYLEKLISSKINYSQEIYIPETEKYYFAKGKLIKDQDLYIVILEDITKYKHLRILQKRFISDVSHELKTPLTNIKGYLVALEEEISSENSEKFMSIIDRNIKKMENLLEDFLNISKIENSKILNIYPVEVEVLLKEVFEDLSILIQKNDVKIKKEIKLRENYIKIDKKKIQTVLKNILENGIHYNNSKKAEIKISITEDNRNYIFKISDNGIGISQGELSKIFERFYRVDKSRNILASTGLGLSIVKEVINQHKGTIDIQSELKEGTSITLKIPKYL